MKILIIIDKLNWSYHSIASSLQKYNNNSSIIIDIQPIKHNVNTVKKIYKKFDRVLVMGWQNYKLVKFLPKKITMVGVHSFQSWDKGQTSPDKNAVPSNQFLDYLRSFFAVNTVSKRLWSLFDQYHVKTMYTPNGVDTEIFKLIHKVPVSDKLIIGYSGTASHDKLKGISEFIYPAAKKAKVTIKTAMIGSKYYIPMHKMCNFYNQVDCYICASSSEGMSLSVLEAGSCGRPIIGTKVSGNTEIIKNNCTGFLINRKLENFIDKINLLNKNKDMLKKMSNNIGCDIRKRWCWSLKVKLWIDFLKQ